MMDDPDESATTAHKNKVSSFHQIGWYYYTVDGTWNCTMISKQNTLSLSLICDHDYKHINIWRK